MKLVELGKEIPKPEVGKEAHEPEVGKEAKEIELIQMKDISGENKNKDSFSGQLKNGKPRNKDEKVEDENEDDKTEDEGIEDERTEVERMKDEKKINGKMIEKTEKIEKLEKIVKTTKVEGEKPTKEEREYILSKVTELQEQFNPVDFKEIINNKNYFNRFWFHAYHMPGDQIENCKNLIINSLRWREEFGVRGITEDDIDPMDKKVGGVFARNRDRSGSKLLVVTVRKHYKDSTKSLARKKFLIYHLERLEREEKGKQISILFDCGGGGIRNMDMDLTQFTVQVLVEYYPDFVNFIIVFDMPWVLHAAWKVIKSLLPAPATKKIKFVSGGSALDEFVDQENRLVAWGGRDTWEYVWEPPVQIVAADIAESTDLMKVTPESLIEFTRQSPDYLEANISIENISSDRIAYKIKTTSPEIFFVKPHTGFIQPNQTQTVRISVPGREKFKNEKFQIISTRSLHELNPSDGFTSGDRIQQIRLNCKPASVVSTYLENSTEPSLQSLAESISRLDGQLNECLGILEQQKILNLTLLGLNLFIVYIFCNSLLIKC